MANYPWLTLFGSLAPSDVLGAPVDATAWALRQAGVPAPQDPVLGSRNLHDIFHRVGELSRADLTPTRQGMVDFTADMAGAPMEAAQLITRMIDPSISGQTARDPLTGGEYTYAGPDVPFSSLWWRNAFNNPSLWGNIRAALQAPSMRSTRGLGDLF